MSKFMQTDCNQPFLLPPDLRGWLPNDASACFGVQVRKVLAGYSLHSV